MATYRTLGSRTAMGAEDTSGNNPGNWTVELTPAMLAVNVPFFEIYKMVVNGASDSTFNIFVDNNRWDEQVRGDFNSWDPTQPLELIPGQNVLFYWSDASTDGSPPTVTVWLRYDIEIPQNRSILP